MMINDDIINRNVISRSPITPVSVDRDPAILAGRSGIRRGRLGGDVLDGSEFGTPYRHFPSGAQLLRQFHDADPKR